MEFVINPEIAPFVFYRFIKRFFIYTVILSSVYYYSSKSPLKIPVTYLWLVVSIIAILDYLSLNIKYKKEKIIFYPDRIIYQRGGFFNDFKDELIIKNISYVRLTLPFLENKFFQTGTIRVESAGAFTPVIILRSISRPNLIYQKIMELMKQNGFRLNQDKIIQRTYPDNFIVLFVSISKSVFWALILGSGFLITILFLNIFGVTEIKNIEKIINNIWTLYFFEYPIATGFILISSIMFGLLSFQNLTKREYELYEDAISYNKRFLSKHYAFIPLENLADSEVEHYMLIIFDIYNIKLSSKGKRKEIYFNYISDGEEMSKNIDKLIKKAGSLAEEK